MCLRVVARILQDKLQNLHIRLWLPDSVSVVEALGDALCDSEEDTEEENEPVVVPVAVAIEEDTEKENEPVVVPVAVAVGVAVAASVSVVVALGDPLCEIEEDTEEERESVVVRLVCVRLEDTEEENVYVGVTVAVGGRVTVSVLVSVDEALMESLCETEEDTEEERVYVGVTVAVGGRVTVSVLVSVVEALMVSVVVTEEDAELVPDLRIHCEAYNSEDIFGGQRLECIEIWFGGSAPNHMGAPPPTISRCTPHCFQQYSQDPMTFDVETLVYKLAGRSQMYTKASAS
eukprot:gene6902-biopygen137